MERSWKPRPVQNIHLKKADRIIGLPGSLALLLARRGITGEELEKFLTAGISAISPWTDIPGASAAADKIATGVSTSRKILIHGDFDADGITATVLMCRALRSLGADVIYHIPDRSFDGYGLGENSVKACIEKGAELVITVDCGMTAVDEVAGLAVAGIDTVVTDHHISSGTLPDAIAIANPVLSKDGRGKSAPAGVGVAYHVLRGVFDILSADNAVLDELLPLVAVGTIADVVELRNDNRVLVAEGMNRMKNNPPLWLTVLTDSASLDINKINSGNIAFQIAPRLNACGRVGHANQAVDLLLTDDIDNARNLAAFVEENNIKRKELDRETLKRALDMCTATEPNGCIVLASENWHRGVIGIAASRLVAKYGMPTLLIALDGDMGHGSCRSIPGISIFDLMTSIQKELSLFDAFGGHHAAAGFSIRKKWIPVLRTKLEEMMSEKSNAKYLGTHILLDGSLEKEDFNLDTVNALSKLEPFGEGNSEPVWLARHVQALTWNEVGKDRKHLSCEFRIGSKTIRSIGFNLADKQTILNAPVDIAFKLTEDTWRSDGSVQMNLIDIRRSTSQRKQ